jgi:hypothetical protein
MITDRKIQVAGIDVSSDYRIKKNVEKLDERFTVDSIEPYLYDNVQINRKEIGFLAHEIQELYPNLVSGEKDGFNYQSLNYLGLIGILVKEVKELKKEVENLKTAMSTDTPK